MNVNEKQICMDAEGACKGMGLDRIKISDTKTKTTNKKGKCDAVIYSIIQRVIASGMAGSRCSMMTFGSVFSYKLLCVCVCVCVCSVTKSCQTLLQS